MKKQDFVGTKTLLGLALRRDRIKLPLWIIGITLMVAAITASYGEFSPQDMKDIVVMASSSPGMRILVAPMAPEGATELGQFFLFRTSLIISVLVAMMSIQIVIRHTRNNEETGCAELIGSTVVGRYASLSAAVILALAANIILSITVAIGFLANGLAADGAFAAGLSFGALGVIFSAIAAITVQLSESGRGSSGIASMFLAIIALLNAMGNVMGNVNIDSLGYESSWLVWLSPIGWAQQVHAFGENNFWILLLFIPLYVVLVRTAFVLVNLRDVGRGIFPARPGPAVAHQSLLSPLGLALRLQRKTFLGWAIPIGIFGLIFGGASAEFADVWDGIEGFENLQIPTELFLLTFIGLFASIIAIYTKQSIIRMYSEENGGPLELTITASVSRNKFMLSHIACSILGSFILLFIVAIGIAVASGASGSELADYLKAAVYQGVAVTAIAGVVIAIYGLIPKISRSLSWIVVFVSLFVGPFFGPMLDLPEGIQNLSPFSHIPTSPAEVAWGTLVILIVIGLGLGAVGLTSFNKRNLSL